MPLYEYRCEDPKCNGQEEVLQRVSDADKPRKCPQCEKRMKRIISGGSFILKGGGWASDGYSG